MGQSTWATGGWGNNTSPTNNKPSTGGWGKPQVQPKPSVDPVPVKPIKIEYKPVEIKTIGGDITIRGKKVELKGWTPDMKKITEIKEETKNLIVEQKKPVIDFIK